MEDTSLITTPVELFQGDRQLSQGTGFFIAHVYDNIVVLFLVTNYHVLTGCSPDDGDKAEGDNIFFNIHLSNMAPDKTQRFKFPLYNSKGHPLWLQSTTYPSADIAILPVPSIVHRDAEQFMAINKQWASNGLKLRATGKMAIVGYPYGLLDHTNALPIWKTGNIASEPYTDFDGQPLILIDISAFPGMSGSPAFAIAEGIYECEDGTIRNGRISRFLGIFASMKMRSKNLFLEELQNQKSLGVVDYESLQLGYVWKASLIFEIIENFDLARYKLEVIGSGLDMQMERK